MNFRKYFLTIILSTSAMLLPGQEYALAQFNRSRLRIERKSTQALAFWSVTNLIYNGFSTRNTGPEDRHFHQSNVYWNIMNLGVAYIGFRHSFPQDPAEVSIYGSIREQRRIEQLLFMKVGIDLATILTGYYLQEHASQSRNKDKLKGYGRSFVLQGATLLGLDLIQLVLHKVNNQKLYPLIRQLQFGAGEIRLRKQF